MLLMGAVISVAGLLGILSSEVVFVGYFTASAGLLNVILGLAAQRSLGVTVPPNNTSSARLLVDKGIVRTSIYQLAFFDTRLIMKKLSSVKVTVILALALFLVGLLLDGLIGGLSGGLTGYAMQEYLTQKNRDRIRKQNTVSTVGRGDLEFGYDDLDKVHLRSSSLQLFFQNGIVRVSLPRGYANKMRTTLESILPDKYEAEPSPHSVNP